MTDNLQKKVDAAIKLLQSVAKTDKDIELAYNGGKDSDVILELAKMAGMPFTAIYKNTTIDPPGTIKHCKENGVQIVQPEITFFELIEQKGFPNQFARFCCSTLKEYKIKETCILGVRREESRERMNAIKNQSFAAFTTSANKLIMPILEWTQRDIKEFIQKRSLQLHPLYYDDAGRLVLTRRLGCIACPLREDRGLAEFKRYPKIVKSWCRAGAIYMRTHPNSRVCEWFDGDVYEWFAVRLFWPNIHSAPLNRNVLFKQDYKQLLSDYFQIDL